MIFYIINDFLFVKFQIPKALSSTPLQIAKMNNKHVETVLGSVSKKQNDEKTPLRIAIAGLGLVGLRHAEAISHVNGISLCAVADPSLESKKYASANDLQHFDALDELIEAVKPDGIILATPTTLHVTQGWLCVDAGIPVLIEKPLANNLAEGEALVKHAEAANVPVLVGHHRRFNPIIRKAHNIISEGQIGEVKSVHATCWFYKPDSYFDIAPWRKREGAGPVSVNLVHDIDLIRHLCGEITQVQAQANPSSRGYDNEDVSAALFIFGKGGIGTVSVSDSIVAPWSWEFTSREYPVYPFTGQSAYQIGGTKGSLSVPDLALWTHDQERDWWSPISSNVIDCGRSDPLINQIDHFASVIRGETIPQVSGCEGLRTLAVIEAIQIAAKTGQTIQLADRNGHQKLAESLRNSENDEANKLNITKLAL
ncbi:MAG: Gfo/Idh/MocA family protein [Candidatus Puniceispirillum sp.]